LIPAEAVTEMICSEGYFYLACENMVLRISEVGKLDIVFQAEGLYSINRNQLGILEVNGQITWHNFRESA